MVLSINFVVEECKDLFQNQFITKVFGFSIACLLSLWNSLITVQLRFQVCNIIGKKDWWQNNV